MSCDISICVITYNHEAYIKETLDSINKQIFSGSVEIIIGVDLSTDKTLSIIEEFKYEFKWPVKVISYDNRQGMFNNLYNVLSLATGKYISMLEGDDYWIDLDKLSKQFSYMEKSNDCLATGGSIKILRDDNIENTGSIINCFSQYYFLNDLVHANRIAFCTVMFRRDKLNLSLLSCVKDSPHLDWPIYLILFTNNTKGHIKVFSDNFSVYRIHNMGVYSGVTDDKRLQNVLKTIKYNKEIIKNIDASNYFNAYEKYTYEKKENLPIPSVRNLLSNSGLRKESLLSFYMQVYGKKNFLSIVFKNILFVPQFCCFLGKKIFNRFFKH